MYFHACSWTVSVKDVCIEYIRMYVDLLCILCRKGDLDELSKHGSLHQYLLHLHQNGHQPIATFWWGQQRIVSICSPEMFKDTIKLTNRPSEIFHNPTV